MAEHRLPCPVIGAWARHSVAGMLPSLGGASVQVQTGPPCAAGDDLLGRAAVLPDILGANLKLVVCGTAAGSRSAQLNRYYAGPGNKFWSLLAELGFTPHRLLPEEAHLLPSFGIGLTDLLKGQSGADSEIDFGRVGSSSLTRKMLALQPRVLCFNGKRAAQEYQRSKAVDYGLQAGHIGSTQVCVAPSTSAAANGSWDASYWRELSELVTAPES